VRGRFACAHSEQDESSQEVQETDGIRCVCLFVLCSQSACWIIIIIAAAGEFCSSLETDSLCRQDGAAPSGLCIIFYSFLCYICLVLLVLGNADLILSYCSARRHMEK